MTAAAETTFVKAHDLVRTYDARAYADTWALVEDYRKVLDYHARHPDRRSTAVGNALGLPRSRVRSWLDGAIPDPVRGIHRAEARGWLAPDLDSRRFRGLNALLSWVFSGGSINRQWYVPRFTVDGEETRARIDRAFDAIGVDYDFTRSAATDRATEYRPVEDAAVLGRVLAVLGGPIGAKNERSRIELPGYLHDSPETVCREFIATYLENRGQRSARKGTVTFREDRAAPYLRSLANLFRRVTGDRVTVSEKNVIVSAAAARTIDDWPPVLVD